MKRLGAVTRGMQDAESEMQEVDHRTPAERAKSIQQATQRLYEMAGGDNADPEIVDELNTVWNEANALAKANSGLQQKLVDAMMKSELMRAQRDIAKADQRVLQQQAVERGLAEISTVMGYDLDMNQRTIERVFRAVMGESVAGQLDAIPPYHIAQLREALQEIERAIFEEEMFAADAEADDQ